jgi:hypothetical protein
LELVLLVRMGEAVGMIEREEAEVAEEGKGGNSKEQGKEEHPEGEGPKWEGEKQEEEE